MRSMDQSLAELVRSGKVAFEVAVDKAANAEDLRRLLGR
jgi:Tfp pilus assembly ATPase PilU